MILEIAMLEVKPGMEEQFEVDFKIANTYISAINGYVKHSLQKCIEQKNKYSLLVEWDTLENHIVDFRQSSEYLKWKKLLHHYYDPFPTVEHFEKVFESKKSDTIE
ncbi:antibiotic biosynthesis monooxygenase family protein [Maribacter arenosus]|uniref:Antibiotic biosynthesis monooxygenase n=1 Tax=Maribacter arenosus TaxID=1854708 RepID=A0ABR7VG72_9FLAO|nr:antibiotic biosynthesis monooxygenase [Maribacter arenosus]MBD0851911.1 antibiotic biosynthesis monooxygenase [Maribacter arenosus]